LNTKTHWNCWGKNSFFDIIALFTDKNFPIDEIGANELAEEILINNPKIGYLTISNALQWRLQYTRIIDQAGKVDGILKLVKKNTEQLLFNFQPTPSNSLTEKIIAL